MAEGYTSIRDMFDGGGAGQSGAQFEGGGFLSAAANAIARPRGSVDRGDADMRTGIGGFLRDAVNGGGWGASGSTFQGAGGYSGLLNMLGVKPMGEDQRMADSQAQLQSQLADLYARRSGGPLAPMTSPRPPVQTYGPVGPSEMPTLAEGGIPNMASASDAIYGEFPVPFGVSMEAPATAAQGPYVGRQIIPSGGNDVAKFYRDLVLGADAYGIPAAGDAGYYNYLRTGRF